MKQDNNCVCDDNFVTQEMIPRYAPMICMYAMGSMITNVHKLRCRQYSKASLDRKVTQKWAMVVINAMARLYNNGYHDTKMRLPIHAYGMASK